jgi:hypothetical protein
MTDIAAIFHWSLSDMAAMDLTELRQWRVRAVDWHNRVVAGKKG